LHGLIIFIDSTTAIAAECRSNAKLPTPSVLIYKIYGTKPNGYGPIEAVTLGPEITELRKCYGPAYNNFKDNTRFDMELPTGVMSIAVSKQSHPFKFLIRVTFNKSQK